MTKEERQGVHLVLDPDQCPETIEFFESMKDSPESIPPYTLASKLVSLDRKNAMPPNLFAFVVSLYEEAISLGIVAAINDLGALYYDGRGYCQDFGKALHYFTMAAEKGYELAVENLGYCYYYGRSVPPDYEKAFQYFAQGAFCGRIISLYKIGDMYRNGYYVSKNPEEAFRIYTQCLRLMTHEYEWQAAGQIYLRLGWAYFKGEGTEKNTHEALACFQKAEWYLYRLVDGGDEMYMKSMKSAVEGQNKARAELAETLPSRSWP